MSSYLSTDQLPDDYRDLKNTVAEFARTVDIAATLAYVLGISPSETLDGKVLRSALRMQ